MWIVWKTSYLLLLMVLCLTGLGHEAIKKILA